MVSCCHTTVAITERRKINKVLKADSHPKLCSTHLKSLTANVVIFQQEKKVHSQSYILTSYKKKLKFLTGFTNRCFKP